MNSAIIRGRTLTFKRTPDSINDTGSYSFIEDGALLVENGIIAKLDSFSNIIVKASKDITVYDHRPQLLVP